MEIIRESGWYTQISGICFKAALGFMRVIFV